MLNCRRISSVALIVALGILLGRALGFLRELALATSCGLTREADLATVAVLWPDLLNAIFMGGGVSAVLIPEFHRLWAAEGVAAANQMACQFLVLIGLAATLIACVIAIYASVMVGILAPGLDGDAFVAGVAVMRIVVIALPICSVVGVTAAILQARDRVLTPSLGNVVLNAVLIPAFLMMPKVNGSLWVSAAVVVAFACRFGVQWIECSYFGVLAQGFHGLWRFGRLGRDLGRRYFQTFSVVGLIVFIPVVGRAFASHTEGGVACFNYAYKLVELPFGLLGAILAMAIFPKLSQMAQRGDSRESLPLIYFTTSAILLATVPLVVFFQGAAEPVVALLYQRGKLQAEHVGEIANLARIAFLALPALVLNAHITSVFHARRDTRAPFVIGLGILLACALTCSYFAGKLDSLMGCIVIIQWLHLALLLMALQTRHGLGLCRTGEFRYYVGATITAIGCSVSIWTLRPAISTGFVSLLMSGVASIATLLALLLFLRSSLFHLRVMGSPNVGAELETDSNVGFRHGTAA